MERYQDLAFEFCASKVTVIPIVIGALGTLSKNARKAWYGKLDLRDIFWKYTVVGHPRNCSPVAESVVSLSCGELLRHD